MVNDKSKRFSQQSHGGHKEENKTEKTNDRDFNRKDRRGSREEQFILIRFPPRARGNDIWGYDKTITYLSFSEGQGMVALCR